MQGVLRGVGWFFLAAAAVLVVLGIASWPPGGLMFALPYFFLMPGVLKKKGVPSQSSTERMRLSDQGLRTGQKRT